MINENDVEKYIDKKITVKLADGNTFTSTYRYWQLDVGDECPNALVFDPPNEWGLPKGQVEIPADEIVSVIPS